MFATKKKYYLIIQNTRDIKLTNIKLFNKFTIIYRNSGKKENFIDLKRFRQLCKRKRIQFFVANNVELTIKLKADGLYISSHNNDLKLARLKLANYKIIGSIHNIKELSIKKKQMCNSYLFSRLFKTNYSFKKDYLGVVKFNLISLSFGEDLIALGGIRKSNINKLKIVNSQSVSLLSEVKKKPAIISRLF